MVVGVKLYIACEESQREFEEMRLELARQVDQLHSQVRPGTSEFESLSRAFDQRSGWRCLLPSSDISGSYWFALLGMGYEVKVSIDSSQFCSSEVFDSNPITTKDNQTSVHQASMTSASVRLPGLRE